MPKKKQKQQKNARNCQEMEIFFGKNGLKCQINVKKEPKKLQKKIPKMTKQLMTKKNAHIQHMEEKNQ